MQDDHIKEYDFRIFTDKDMFQILLAGITPDFGYIADTTRKEFSEFCVDNGLIHYFSTTINKHARLHDVAMTFHFSAAFGYGHERRIFTRGISVAIVYNDFKMISTSPR